MTIPADARKTERITARIAPSALKKIELAASISGATVNQFLVSCALSLAEEVIEKERLLKLSQDEARRLFDILERPPEPNEKLKAAFRSYQDDSLDVERQD